MATVRRAPRLERDGCTSVQPLVSTLGEEDDAPPPRRTDFDRIIQLRFWILGTVAVASAVVAGGRGDWNMFVDAGRAMLGPDGFHVFARHPDVQTGPLTLLLAPLLALTGRNGFVLSVLASSCLGLLCVRTVERMQRQAGRQVREVTSMIGGVATMFWWAKLGGYGHLDDAMVLTLTVLALREARSDRPTRSALLLGIAIGVKPWAVIFLPMTIAGQGRLRDRLKPALVTVLVGGLLWAPFLLLVPETVRSMRATVHVAADSVLQVIGLADATVPSWLRSAQLLTAMAVASFVLWRRGPSGVILAAVAVRLASDPGTWSYYTVGLVLGAFVWDMLETRRAVPIATIACSILLLPSWIVPSADARIVMRLVACVGAVTLALFARSRVKTSANELDAQAALVP